METKHTTFDHFSSLLNFVDCIFIPIHSLFFQSPSPSHRSKERLGHRKYGGGGGKVAGEGKKMPQYKYSRKTMASPSHDIELAHT
jgi:hypothetical protein